MLKQTKRPWTCYALRRCVLFCACGTLLGRMKFTQEITYKLHLIGNVNALAKKSDFTKKSELSIKPCSVNVALVFISTHPWLHPVMWLCCAAAAGGVCTCVQLCVAVCTCADV